MGAPRIRPAADGVIVDALWVAEQLGRPVAEVYADARDGLLPPPVQQAIERKVSPQRWRWSRVRILATLDAA